MYFVMFLVVIFSEAGAEPDVYSLPGKKYEVHYQPYMRGATNWIATVHIKRGQTRVDLITYTCTKDEKDVIIVEDNYIMLEGHIYSDKSDSLVVIKKDGKCYEHKYIELKTETFRLEDSYCNNVKQALKDKTPLAKDVEKEIARPTQAHRSSSRKPSTPPSSNQKSEEKTKTLPVEICNLPGNQYQVEFRRYKNILEKCLVTLYVQKRQRDVHNVEKITYPCPMDGQEYTHNVDDYMMVDGHIYSDSPNSLIVVDEHGKCSKHDYILRKANTKFEVETKVKQLEDGYCDTVKEALKKKKPLVKGKIEEIVQLPGHSEYKLFRRHSEGVSSNTIAVMKDKQFIDVIEYDSPRVYKAVEPNHVVVDGMIYSDSPYSVVVLRVNSCELRSYEDDKAIVSTISDFDECAKVKLALVTAKSTSNNLLTKMKKLMSSIATNVKTTSGKRNN